MAIVQISKIQHRRGKKNEGPGLPQLASGEFGWAIDTQELYIGNGSVAEGAPEVGNTRILTENDITGAGDLNLFDIVLYTYKKDPSLLTYARPLQQRLDDNVSVRSFGVVFTDSSNEIDGTNLQLAIDKLFNSATKGTPYAGTELVIPEGVYVVTSPLVIPPYTTLKGAGKDKTIIKNVGTGPVFYTVDVDYNDGPTTYQAQSRNIHISGITFEGVAGQPVVVLNSTRDSVFKDVKFKGQWTTSNVLVDEEMGISLVATSQAVSCQNNTFDNFVVEGVSYAIDSTTDIHHNTFTNGNITLCGAGVIFGYAIDGKSTGAKLYGPSYNKIVNTRFSYIIGRGIDINLNNSIYLPDSANPAAPLIGNLSQGNTFINVGTGLGDSTEGDVAVIRFGRSGNLSENDFFDRAVELGTDGNNFNVPYASEYTGSVIGSHKYNTAVSVVYTDAPVPLFRLSAITSAGSRFRIYYFYQSEVASVTRQGVLNVTVDYLNSTVHLSEEYDVNGAEGVAENLTLSAELDADNISLNVNYTNLTADDDGSFRYWYEIIS